jgi:MFS family permease
LPVLAAESFPARLRVEAVSGFAVMSKIGAAIGPLLSGLAIEYGNGIAGFTTMLALASVAAGVVVLVLRRWNADIRTR